MLRLLAAAVACSLAGGLVAQQPPGPPAADGAPGNGGPPRNPKVARLAALLQKGPTTAPVGAAGEIKVPAGYSYVGREGAKLYTELTGNLPNDDELINVFLTADPFAERNTPYFVFTYEDSGHVKDTDEKLDADEILKALRAGTLAGNQQRKAMGLEELEIAGWALPPQYDPVSKNLVWATRIKAIGEPGESVNHQTRILGRTGVMEVVLVCGTREFAEVKDKARDYLMKDFSFKEGQRHADFRQGDKVAQYGLAALVTGGALAVAAKTGILQKFGKLIVVGVLAVVAGLGKLFKSLFGRRG